MITAAILACAATAGGPVTCENYLVKTADVKDIAECVTRVDTLIIPPLVAMGAEIRAAACKIDEPAEGDE